MNPELETALREEFTRWEGAVGTPVPYAEIDQAERTLDVSFPKDYRDFVHQYGGAVIGGTSILGLRQPPLMPDEPPFVTEETLRSRSELPASHSKMVVISIDGFGNPIGFVPADPSIIIFNYDFGGPSVLAPSFEEYVALLLSGEDE